MSLIEVFKSIIIFKQIKYSFFHIGQSPGICPPTPGGIIPGAVFVEIVGAFANFTDAVISGDDHRLTTLCAAGGFIGRGIFRHTHKV